MPSDSENFVGQGTGKNYYLIQPLASIVLIRVFITFCQNLIGGTWFESPRPIILRYYSWYNKIKIWVISIWFFPSSYYYLSFYLMKKLYWFFFLYLMKRLYWFFSIWWKDYIDFFFYITIYVLLVPWNYLTKTEKKKKIVFIFIIKFEEINK